MSGNYGQILDAHTIAEIEHWLGKYPPEQRQSAVLAALRAAQHQNHGYLTVEIMDAVAEYLGMPRIAVYEVATFYSMFETKPAGRHSISVCTNISCMLNGADDLVAYIEGKLGIKTGESTSDGRFHLKREEECLAACCGGPMLMVDHVYHENLTKAKIDRILEQLD
jgi:NADH-quinone oxidoreductase subunit E